MGHGDLFTLLSNSLWSNIIGFGGVVEVLEVVVDVATWEVGVVEVVWVVKDVGEEGGVEVVWVLILSKFGLVLG